MILKFFNCTFCRIFQVVSKTNDDGPAYSALFMSGKRQPVEEYPGKTPRHHGTMVTALDLFYNLPVRQKAVAAAVELDAVRHGLCALALVHPTVAFQLKNESSGENILGTKRSGSTVAAFTQLFGSYWGKSLREVSASDGTMSVRGFVSSEGISNKRKQFVYLNGRFAKKSSLQKAVNEVLKKKSVMCKSAPAAATKTAWEGGGVNQESPTKATAMHAVYCIRISCSASDFVAGEEPNRTNVDFRDWPAVRAFLEDALTRFLQENGLLNVSAAAALAMAEAKSDAGAAPARCPAGMNLSLNVTGILPLESQIPEGAFEEATEPDAEYTFAEDVTEPIEGPDSDLARPSFRPFGLEYEGSRQSVPVVRPGSSVGDSRKRDHSGNDAGEVAIPDGWIKKTLPDGKPVFVHLKSGNTVQKLRSLVSSIKRSRPVSHPTSNNARETVIDRMLPGMCPIAAVGRPRRRRTTKASKQFHSPCGLDPELFSNWSNKYYLLS